MVWIDQKDVAKQHLGLAADALERATADATVSRDVVAALTELRAASVALAKMAGVGFDEEAPPLAERSGQNGGGSAARS